MICVYIKYCAWYIAEMGKNGSFQYKMLKLSTSHEKNKTYS
jgi:hypothetical protein